MPVKEPKESKIAHPGAELPGEHPERIPNAGVAVGGAEKHMQRRQTGKAPTHVTGPSRQKIGGIV